MTDAMGEHLNRTYPHLRALFESKWWIALWLIAAAEWLELMK